MAVYQALKCWLTCRYREQARSHRGSVAYANSETTHSCFVVFQAVSAIRKAWLNCAYTSSISGTTLCKRR
ncbi:hypothetical protein SAMN04488697_10924 [Pseudomonas sp. 43mfcvi1.1]|jgi:hypothetical protein|nr:hypothetical protein ATJ40_10924 [Pseudomonas sp. 43mfcvi1.1]SSB97686.1 hypothetical protein SAMN04488697_10924 [Pseudomonas sp. 43mfcvi1.1]